MRTDAVSAFRIETPQEVLDDLRERLARIRWPDAVTGDAEDWSWGTPPPALRALVDRWRGGYDWRATQARLNTLDQRLVRVGDRRIHVVRAGTPGATPLMLMHGWPDGFLRFEKALPLLADRFDIVVPTIPGFGFSDRPTAPGTGPNVVADLFAEVMTTLGFARFGVHGADLGSTVAETLALRHPDRVVGVHLGDVPAWRRYTVDPAALDADGRAHADRMAAWLQAEGGYAILQRTKPQTLAYALADSPVGLAAWFLEKFRAWSDTDGTVWDRFAVDEVLDDIMLYWVTGTAGSAARYYRESALADPEPSGRVAVPAGFTVFPRDIAPPPRSYAELFYDVRRFTTAPRGGHFGPWEEPGLFADDLRAFFDGLD